MARLCVASVLTLVLFACGDDGTPPTDTGTPTDTSVDTGTPDAADTGGGGGETVSVIISNGRDDSPIEGAIVGLEAADGASLEVTTGADGRATFVDVVVTDEPGWITAVADGWAVLSVNLTTTTLAVFRANSDRFPIVARRRNPDLVTITGTIANPMSATNWFTVIADAPGSTNHQAVGPDFEIEVPRDTAFSVTALEWDGTSSLSGVDQTFYGTVLVTSDGFAADGTLDIDMTDSPLPYETATGTLPQAPAGHPLEGAAPYGFVRHLPPKDNAIYGVPSSVATNMDMTAWDFEMTWIEPPDATEPQTVYQLFRTPLFSGIAFRGYPTSGDMDFEWLSPPDVMSPGFGASAGLHDTITFDAPDSGVAPILDIFEEEPLDNRWLAVGPQGATELTLPSLPASVNEDDVLPATGLVGRVRTCEPDPMAIGKYCQRFAAGRVFELTR